MEYTRKELRRMPVDQLMAEVAKRVRKVQGLERVCTSTVPNTERVGSNGLVWNTGTVYGYAEERLREDRKVFPWLKGGRRMSIIIKGMKMPQKEGDYDARLHVNRDGTALFYLYQKYGVHVAKELPPHGRLIDAEALDKEPCDVVEDRFPYSVLGYSLEKIKNAPTIIEAEEGE